MMIRYKLFLTFAIMGLFIACKTNETTETDALIGKFNPSKDLLLGQFDCKTDVDDLHTVAGFTTLLSDPDFSDIKFHAIAGTYGIQEGLYVPPNDLFQLAFGNNWTDAHANRAAAVSKVTNLAIETLDSQGDIWIAEAGQSDFSAAIVKTLKRDQPNLNTKQRIHIVQHSEWNQESTDPESLQYVKDHTDYHKIPDGNATNNGTPGFRDPAYQDWNNKIKDSRLNNIWQLAIDLSNTYNGQDGRYNNEAIAAGGLDFSDLSETCWILGLEDIKDVTAFFKKYGR